MLFYQRLYSVILGVLFIAVFARQPLVAQQCMIDLMIKSFVAKHQTLRF